MSKLSAADDNSRALTAYGRTLLGSRRVVRPALEQRPVTMSVAHGTLVYSDPFTE